MQVELRSVAATTVAAVEDDVELDAVLGWYAGAMAELDATAAKRAGAPGGVYDNALSEVGRGHAGDHDDIDVTYGEVGARVVANALAVAGPIRETYLVGPRDTADPAAWRTEIGWPVFRVGENLPR